MTIRRRNLLALLGLGITMLISPGARRKNGASGADSERHGNDSGHAKLSWPVKIPEKAIPRDIGPGMNLAG